MDEDKDIISRIIELKDEKGLRFKKEFADFVCLSPTRMNYYYNRKSNPDLEAIIKISSACKVNIWWLLTGEGEKYISTHLEPSEKSGITDGAIPDEIKDSINRLFLNLDKSKASLKVKTVMQILEILSYLSEDKVDIVLKTANAFLKEEQSGDK